MTRARARCLSFLYLLCASIRAPLEAQARPQTRDTIVYAAHDHPVAVWSVSPEPSLVIGPDDGSPDAEFWNIVGISRLADGSWAVADQGSTEVRVFSTSGMFLRSIGGKGEGPGEMASLWQLFASGDTLIAVDGSGVAHRFKPDGSFLDRQSLRGLGGSVPASLMDYRGGRAIASVAVAQSGIGSDR